MATPSLLDVGILSFFLPIFVFIFIFTILLALLEKSEILGKGQKLLNVAAAFSVAAISIFAGKLTSLVSVVIPWIVFIFVLLLLIFVIFGFFGVKDKDIWDLFGETTVFVVILVIVLVGITIVFETTLTPYSGGSGGDGTSVSLDGTVAAGNNPQTETLKTLTHPRLLGALFTLIIAASTVSFLTRKLKDG
ncbi:MAG: hypothetical protein WC595_04635 [Candidatus Nanoarchaeia archaeon]